MEYFERIQKALIEFKHTRVISIITVLFALIYHIVFLFVFRGLAVYPMFYYNFISVTVFLALSIIVPRLKSFIVPYTVAFFEVVVHQVLADYYVGANSAFHYFILLIGLLPVVAFERHYFFVYVVSSFGVSWFYCT